MNATLYASGYALGATVNAVAPRLVAVDVFVICRQRGFATRLGDRID